jgi:multicomponent Na+:H+ antiporter subunit B
MPLQMQPCLVTLNPNLIETLASKAMVDTLIDIALLAFLAVTAFAIIKIRNLFVVIMLFGIFSLHSAGLFVVMDAADVAFTEAAVGAGISSVLMLATLAITKEHEEKKPAHHARIPLLVVLITGAALVYGTYDIPAFGNPDSPAQQHVKPYYIEHSIEETGTVNVVTAVLASYRGYDTLGEVTVIFTAGIGVMLLIGGRLFGSSKRSDDQ